MRASGEPNHKLGFGNIFNGVIEAAVFAEACNLTISRSQRLDFCDFFTCGSMPVDQQTSRYANAIQMGNPWLLKWNNQKGTPHGVKSSKCELSSANCMSKITDTLTARVMQQVFNPTFTVRPAICTDGNERNVFDVAIHLRVYTQTFEKGGHVTAEEWHASPNYNREDWVRLAKSLVDYVGNHSVIPAVYIASNDVPMRDELSSVLQAQNVAACHVDAHAEHLKHNMHAAENNDAMETMFTDWMRLAQARTLVASARFQCPQIEAADCHIPKGLAGQSVSTFSYTAARWGLQTYAKLTTRGLISFPCEKLQIDSARSNCPGKAGKGTQIT